jgi:hypothetical protein
MRTVSGCNLSRPGCNEDRVEDGRYRLDVEFSDNVLSAGEVVEAELTLEVVK